MKYKREQQTIDVKLIHSFQRCNFIIASLTPPAQVCRLMLKADYREGCGEPPFRRSWHYLWSLWRGFLLMLLAICLAGFGLNSAYGCDETCDDYPAANTALGNYTLHSITTGSNDTALGNYAMDSDTSGSDNTAVGAYASALNLTGSRNTAIGSGALWGTEQYPTGSDNTGVGAYVLAVYTSGIDNTALGSYALGNLSSGNGNTASGF